MNKMILLEGIDGVGKSTLIDYAIKTYPDKFFTFAFPSPTFKTILKMWYNEMSNQNIDHMVAKNSLFLADFLNYQEFLKKARLFRKTLLLNRYFYSSLAYAKEDFDKLTNDTEVWDQLKYTKYYPFMDTLVKPDHTILLQDISLTSPEGIKNKNDNGYDNESLFRIDRNYIPEIDNYNEYRINQGNNELDVISISALNDYTTNNFMQLLKELVQI